MSILLDINLKGALSFFLFLYLSFGTAPKILAAEANPPVLNSISADKTSINAGLSQSITFTMSASDESGINWSACCAQPGSALLQIKGPANQYKVSWGRDHSPGTFEVVFNPSDASGNWEISSLALVDNVGNVSQYNSAQLVELGLPQYFEVTGGSESTPPVLDAISADKTSINAGLSQSITFTMSASDESGINWSACCDQPGSALLRIKGPSNQYKVSWGREHSPGTFEVVFNPSDASGNWEISYLAIVDSVGNVSQYNSAQLVELGLPQYFEVTGGSESTPPVLEAISADKTSINAGLSQSITFTMSASDESGINWSACCDQPGSALLRIKGPSNQYKVSWGREHSPGTFEVVFNPSDASGNWEISYLAIVDSVGNVSQYNSAQLVELGLPQYFLIFSDTDGDGIVNEDDPDDDNDGVLDISDPTVVSISFQDNTFTTHLSVLQTLERAITASDLRFTRKGSACFTVLEGSKLTSSTETKYQAEAVWPVDEGFLSGEYGIVGDTPRIFFNDESVEYDQSSYLIEVVNNAENTTPLELKSARVTRVEGSPGRLAVLTVVAGLSPAGLLRAYPHSSDDRYRGYVHLENGSDYVGGDFVPQNVKVLPSGAYEIMTYHELTDADSIASPKIKEILVCDAAMRGEIWSEDQDQDGIIDVVDAFSSVSIVGFPDSDGDGRPDECNQTCLDLLMTADDDDDGDGYSDAFENLAGTDPLDPADYTSRNGFINARTHSISADPDASAVQVKVQRLFAEAGEASVQYRLIEGPGAKAGSTYVDQSGSLNWANGDSQDKVITIEFIPTKPANRGAFFVELYDPSPGSSLMNSRTQIYLDQYPQDKRFADWAGEIFVAESLPTFGEGTTQEILVERRGSSLGQMSANYDIRGCSTNINEELSSPRLGELVWEDGDADPKAINLVFDENDSRMDRRLDCTFKLYLSNVSPVQTSVDIGVLEGGGKEYLVYNNDFTRPIVHAAQAMISVMESMGEIDLNLVRRGPPNKVSEVVVEDSINQTGYGGYYLRGINGVHYSLPEAEQTLVWEEGDVSLKSVTLTLQDDAYQERDVLISLETSGDDYDVYKRLVLYAGDDEEIHLAADSDGDGVEDRFDPDMDNDGVDDWWDLDADGDGYELNDDSHPADPNQWLDSDYDGISDERDWKKDDGVEQFDTDDDGVGDNADNDDDNDGVIDDVDNCRLTSNADQLNTDGDAAGNACDDDDDNDGESDDVDNCPLISNAVQPNTDGDAVGNACDDDDDNDGVLDTADAFSLISLGSLTDTDGDGRPNDCDSDCRRWV